MTGLGVVSQLGSGLDKFWRSLCEGRSAAGPITLFDASEFSVRIAAEVTSFPFFPNLTWSAHGIRSQIISATSTSK